MVRDTGHAHLYTHSFTQPKTICFQAACSPSMHAPVHGPSQHISACKHITAGVCSRPSSCTPAHTTLCHARSCPDPAAHPYSRPWFASSSSVSRARTQDQTTLILFLCTYQPMHLQQGRRMWKRPSSRPPAKPGPPMLHQIRIACKGTGLPPIEHAPLEGG